MASERKLKAQPEPQSGSRPATGGSEPKPEENEDNRVRRIRERAYAIWVEQGQTHGRDQEHWREAERQIDGE